MVTPSETSAVIRVPGPAWVPALPMRGQAGWAEHARFMNDLAARGKVRLGGPLEDGPTILRIVEGSSVEDVRSALSEDRWHRDRILVVQSVHR